MDPLVLSSQWDPLDPVDPLLPLLRLPPSIPADLVVPLNRLDPLRQPDLLDLAAPLPQLALPVPPDPVRLSLAE